MNVIICTIITTLLVYTYGQLIEPEHVHPCQYVQQAQIVCMGVAITDATLKEVGQKVSQRAPRAMFKALVIRDTALTMIEKDHFPNVTFDNIYIESNKYLTSIDPDAFAHQNTRLLFIRDNPTLSDTRIFQLANNLHVYQWVEFDYNSIKEIPENAFKPPTEIESHLHEHIKLNHNKIEKIGANAFKYSTHLSHLTLDNNLLSKIDDNAFNFNDEHLVEITIDLQHNQLSSKSFTTKSFYMPPNMKAIIGLENNLFTDLSEEIFKPLIDNGSVIKLEGNKFYCGCDVKWIIESPHKGNIQGLICNNLNNRDIQSLTLNELSPLTGC